MVWHHFYLLLPDDQNDLNSWCSFKAALKIQSHKPGAQKDVLSLLYIKPHTRNVMIPADKKWDLIILCINEAHAYYKFTSNTLIEDQVNLKSVLLFVLQKQVQYEC